MPLKILARARLTPVVAGVLIAACGLAGASSHREAPFITTAPKVDGTDFYMFRSYEAGRSDYVTLIANYQPLQAAYGDDLAARIKAWQRAVAESQRLADEFAQRVGGGQPFDALPLA